jgi:secondary thiamine-phosphate synthase enzyme
MSLGRNFHKALAASGFANLADGVMWVALPLLAVQLTRSPLLIAGVTVAARAPWLLLSLVAGALADRLDRRQTMIRVNLVRTVLLGGLALAVAGDLASLAMLYAVAVLLGIAETLFDTSAQSLLPAIVDRDDLTRANSRLFAVELVANEFAGPPLGGLLAAAGLAVALGLPAAAYLVGAGCSLISALPGGRGRAPGVDPAAGRNRRGRASSGARRCVRWPSCRGREHGLAAAFGVRPVRRRPRADGPSGPAWVLLPRRGRVAARHWLAVRRAPPGRVRTLVVSVVLTGASLLVPAVTTSPVLVGASFVVSGVAIVLWNVVTVSLRQRITPDRLLGRMNAAYRLVGWGTMPIGAVLGGFLAEALGLRATFAVAAARTLAVLAGFRFVTEPAVAAAEAAEAPQAPPGRVASAMDTTELRIDTGGRHVLDLTDRAAAFAAEAGGDGLLQVFVPHATAGLAVMETGSGSEKDLEEVLARLLPRDDRWSHRHGSRGHGADHLLPVFAGPSLTVPVQAGRLLLGTWQRICLVDLNDDNPRRRVRLSFLRG